MSEAENETPGIFSIEETSKEVTINHTVPPDMPLLFSDQMIVRSQGGLFQLYFFQTRPPIALTPDDIRSIDQIEAVCIGQFVITPEQMARNIEALSTNYKRHLEKIEVAKAGKR